MTGRTADGFAEVVLGSRKGWVASTYLEATTGLPAVPNEEVAEAALAHSDVLIPFASVDPAKGAL